jgi:DNA-directed RNA polymerase specialized sigma24 family protein
MDDRTNGLMPSPEHIFRDYAPRVYNLARRMLGNDADAEDVSHQGKVPY